MRVYILVILTCCSAMCACDCRESSKQKERRLQHEHRAYTEQDKQVLSGQATEKTKADVLIDIIQAKSEKSGLNTFKLHDFLSDGVDPNVKTDDIYQEPVSTMFPSSIGVYIATPLQQAIYSDWDLTRLSTTLELLRHNVYIDAHNNYGDTALHIASKKGSFDGIAMLLAFGASADIENNNGEKPEDCVRVRQNDARVEMGKSHPYHIQQAMVRYLKFAREKRCYELFACDSEKVPGPNFLLGRIGKVAMGQSDFNSLDNALEDPDTQLVSVYQDIGQHAALLENRDHPQKQQIGEYATYIASKLTPSESKKIKNAALSEYRF